MKPGALPPPPAAAAEEEAPMELPLSALTPLEPPPPAAATAAPPMMPPLDHAPAFTPSKPRTAMASIRGATPRKAMLDLDPTAPATSRADLRSLDPPAPAPGSPEAPGHAPTFIPNWDTTPKEIEPPSRAPFYVGVAAAVAVALSGVGVVIASLLKPPPTALSIDEERAIGDEWLKSGAEALGGLRTDAVSSTAERVVAAVAVPLRAQLGARVARAAVVKDDANATSFALPDATVVVTTGLLLRLTSEAELAALCAHALAHVALGHPALRLAGSEHVVRDSLAAGTGTVALGAVLPTVTAPYDATAEAQIDALVLAALRGSGWDPQAYSSAIARLTVPTPASWLAAHAIDAARLKVLSGVEASGRGGKAEYEKRVLDVLRPPPPPRTDPSKRRPAGARAQPTADGTEEPGEAEIEAAAAPEKPALIVEPQRERRSHKKKPRKRR